MEMTLRWYGSKFDTVTLQQIRQIPGVTGVITTLYDTQPGEVWSQERIHALKEEVEAAGLHISGIESVNIHEDIKLGKPSRDQLIANYIETLENLGKEDIHMVCYNFMPVFDWVKSDLDYVLPDGSSTLAFREADVPEDPNVLLDRYAKGTGDFVLPGWEPERLAQIRHLFDIYRDVDEDALRRNLVYFLEGVIPTCEECGVKMAIHPDDPPYSLFGLPRIVKNREDLDWLCRAVDSPANGITLCTGSIAEDPANDVYAILAEFTRRGRIHFVHARNIRYLEPGRNRDFYEAGHWTGAGSLDMFRIMAALHDNGFEGYIRPDHGRMIWGETGRAGYGLYDRALGCAYLNGLWEALEKRSA